MMALHPTNYLGFFQWLDLSDALQMGYTCKTMHNSFRSEPISKMLLHRDIRYYDFSVAYDVCCIEHSSFRETYRDVHDALTTTELGEIGDQYRCSKPTSLHMLKQAVPYFIRGLSKGHFQCLTRILDCLGFIIREEPSNAMRDKIQAYTHLFMLYTENRQIEKDFEICWLVVGMVTRDILQDVESAKLCFARGMEQHNSDGFWCFVEGLYCENMFPIIGWCEKAAKQFPTRKYVIWFALATRHQNTNRAIELCLESLFELDKFEEAKMSDDLITKPHHNVKRLEILKKLAELLQKAKRYEESYKYWKLALDYANTSDEIYYVLIRTVKVLYDYLNKTDEAFRVLTGLLSITLTDRQKAKCHHWVQVITEQYLLNRNFFKIQEGVALFSVLATTDAIRSAHEYQCLLHYFHNDFGSAIESGLLAEHPTAFAENRRLFRYLGRCHIFLGEYQKANEYFTRYLDQQRNSAILMELALLCLKMESEYYNLGKAEYLLKEARSLDNKPPAFDELETLEHLDRALRDRKRKHE
jgi:tetratricopeptide (TPR) repeat protein